MLWTFYLTQGIEGVCKDSICAYMVLYAPFLLIWHAIWLISGKNCFWHLTPPQGLRVCKGQNMSLDIAAFGIPFNLIINITMFWWSWILTFWHHPFGRGSTGKIFATICYYVRAIPFNLNGNMTIFRKSWILTSALPPKSTKGVWGRPRPSNYNPIWHFLYLLYLCLHAKFW